MNIIKLSLILGLINYTLIAMAATPNTSCITKDKKAAPPVAQRTTTDSNNNIVDTQPWIDWKAANSNWATTQSWGCCEKLELNTSTNVCEDKSIADQDLQSCSNHTECNSGKGCLNWREEDMFDETRVSTEAEKDALNIKSEAFEKAREEYDELSPVGGFCFTNMQCESYKCSGLECKENKICRLAQDTDPATPPAVKCEEPFIKNTSDICENPNSTYYNGLLGELAVTTKGGGQCQFELQPVSQDVTAADIPRAVNLAITTTRAAEWLYSTLSKSNSMSERDCVYAKDYFRDEMTKLVADRKTIIKEFNREFKLIEENFAQLQAAKQDDMGTVATLCGDTVTNHDIAMRKATGKDFLCYMRERNNLFLQYESSMFDWTTQFNKVFTTYENEIKAWGEGDKSWVIGGKSWGWKNSRTCRYWVDLYIGVLTPKKLKNRWISRYRAKYTSPSEMFNKYVETIGIGGNVDRLKKWHWQLDPLKPGQENMTVENFVKSLRLPETPEKDFIHEPEVAASFELRGCINKVNAPECARYKKYLEDIAAAAQAQQLMYSHHTKRKFKSYYKNEGSSRRRLISRYVTDTSNLLNYYTATTSLRLKQNECIDRVLTQLDVDFNNEGTGITQGTSNYYQSTSTNYAGANGNQQNYNTPKIKQSTRAPIQFNIAANRNSLKDIANKDDMSKTNSAGSGSMNAAAIGALAARTKSLQDQNTKALAKGAGVKNMSEDLMAAFEPTKGSASSGRGSSFGSLSNSASGAGGEAGKKATLDKDANSANTNASASNGSTAGQPTSGTVKPVLGSIYSGSNQTEYPNGNPTGMSDEEKDRMSASYDRTRSEYVTNEDDSLFQVLSKTYVRNLDKIMVRKKRLDSDAEEEPSKP